MLYYNEDILCLRCLSGLPRTCFHNDRENDVARMFWGRIPVLNATAYMFFTKNSPYRKILHELKYKGQKHIGESMGRLFGLDLANTPFSKVDMIHPVPLHQMKLRERGYNQSEQIALGISRVIQVPVVSDLIIRCQDTKTQTKKSRYERWENVKETFEVVNKESLTNKHILLVDDVITTGATIEACASCLLGIPGINISVASLAYAKLL
jgi:ComF family protein